jgi:hypothetical protein
MYHARPTSDLVSASAWAMCPKVADGFCRQAAVFEHPKLCGFRAPGSGSTRVTSVELRGVGWRGWEELGEVGRDGSVFGEAHGRAAGVAGRVAAGE